MFRKLVLTVSLAFAIAIPAAAQDWWNLKPWPVCNDGQIYVWSGGGMTCSAEQSLAAYALLAGADFTGPVTITPSAAGVFSFDDLAFSAELESQTDDYAASYQCVVVPGDGASCTTSVTSGTSTATVSQGTGSYSIEANTIELGAEEKVTINQCSSFGPHADYSTISNEAECDSFFDTTLHIPCFYNGSAWKSAIDGTTDCTSGS